MSGSHRKRLVLLATWLLDGSIAMMFAVIASVAAGGHPLVLCLAPAAFLPLANLFRAGLEGIRIGEAAPSGAEKGLMLLLALALTLAAGAGAFMVMMPAGPAWIAAAAGLLAAVTLTHALSAPRYGVLARQASTARIRTLAVAQVGLVVLTVWLGRYGSVIFLAYLVALALVVKDAMKAAEEEKRP